MTKLTVVWTDGESETIDATGWRKKDDYLWISLGGGDLVLVPLAGVKKVSIKHDQPKRSWSFDGTSEADMRIDCTGTGDWYPDAVIICGL